MFDRRQTLRTPRVLRAAVACSLGLFSLVAATSCVSRLPGVPDEDVADAALIEPATPVEPAQALERLIEGNGRFAVGQMLHPRQTVEQRDGLAHSQAPYAVILGCSDSRTPPEAIFDQGLGDLFVLRVAGNVLDDHALGSIEYAVEHVRTRLVVVLGHERCGAVKAACKAYESGTHDDSHIQSLIDAIQPAVAQTTGLDAEATCYANIRNQVAALRTSEPVLQRLETSGQIEVVGAWYDLDTGLVTYLTEE